jgi:hypothetical protein
VKSSKKSLDCSRGYVRPNSCKVHLIKEECNARINIRSGFLGDVPGIASQHCLPLGITSEAKKLPSERLPRCQELYYPRSTKQAGGLVHTLNNLRLYVPSSAYPELYLFP